MDNRISTASNQQVATYQPPAHSVKLIASIVKLETANKIEAKMELAQTLAVTMPNGTPNYLSVVKFPSLATLIKSQGKDKMIKAVFLLVKDFCDCINVVRNMNEDQMIESAIMLIEECGSFRLEDYLTMFAMAKRGRLFKIFDRVDLQTISAIVDAYDKQSIDAAYGEREADANRFDSMGRTDKALDALHPQDARAIELSDRLSGTIEQMKVAIRASNL